VSAKVSMGSNPVAEHEALVGFSGSGVGGGGAVAVEHLAGLPADEAHQRVVVAAGEAPLVGEGVAEHVRVQLRNAGCSPPLPDHLADAVVGHPGPAVDPKPQGRKVGTLLAVPLAEVAVERLRGLCSRTGMPGAGDLCPSRKRRSGRGQRPRPATGTVPRGASPCRGTGG